MSGSPRNYLLCWVIEHAPGNPDGASEVDEWLRTATCVRDNLMEIEGEVGGFCGEAAYALAHLIDGTVVLGGYQFGGKPSEFENPHYWVEKGGYVIDPTAEQYGDFEGPIVTKTGDNHYVYTEDTFRDDPSQVRRLLKKGFIDPAISMGVIEELLKANCTAGIGIKKRKPAQGLVIEGWHSSPTGELGISDPEKSTEGVGYYVALEKETAQFFGRVVLPTSITLFNPLDARGEAAYLLLEEDVVMEPPRPKDSEWLSAIKEAVSRSGTTDENWGRNQAQLNQALTDVLQDRGYDGILIENWAVKFASPEDRAGLEGYLKSENPAHIRPEIEAMAMNNPFINVESADVKETFTYSDHPVAIVDVFEFGGMWNPVNRLIMFDSKTWGMLNEEEKRILLDHEIVEREFAMEDYARYQSHSAAWG